MGKTLKSQLLKKLSIKFCETQDSSSTNGKPKLLFYDYGCHIFFLQPIAEGNCEGNKKAYEIIVLLFNQIWTKWKKLLKQIPFRFLNLMKIGTSIIIQSQDGKDLKSSKIAVEFWIFGNLKAIES